MSFVFFKIVVFSFLTINSAYSLDKNFSDEFAEITSENWNFTAAKHLFERAGFGGTIEQVKQIAQMSPKNAVFSFTRMSVKDANLKEFIHSDIYDSSLEPFPKSRPLATKLAKINGEAMGVKVKPDGNRRLQPVVDRFFYWLRASRLETQRVSYWWSNRMLNSKFPLREKITLFWHGHFANSEEKIRDYRKLLNQNQLFRDYGLGNFRNLIIKVSQDPAMLSFLDAGENIKGAPNENFAREIMELFTMGVGHYSESDIREAARAFTGWSYKNLVFYINKEKHDESPKKFLGKAGNFDGIDIIDIILEKKETSEFLASKIYKYFVNNELNSELKIFLGSELKKRNYNINSFLEMIFLSKHFYKKENVANRIKPPVELIISTYRKLGLNNVPGVPDFNIISSELGQKLFFPPTVAGWANGKSWITPSLLLSRANFAYDVLFPNIGFIPPDRYPPNTYNILYIHRKISSGLDISAATTLDGKDYNSESMKKPDKQEDFNTRLGSYRGWQKAIEKVKPINRDIAKVNLTSMILKAKCKTAKDITSFFINSFISVKLSPNIETELNNFLINELGTDNISLTTSYMEEPLRSLLHIILSLPEYQLG